MKRWRLDRERTAPGDAVILVYHRVADLELDRWRLAVSPSRFGEHLSVITERFRPVSMDELSTAVEAAALPRRAVAVTFDDGYRDNLEVARPLLEQYEMPASVFIVTGYLGSERGFWWDELEQLHRRADLPELRDLRSVWSRLRDLPPAPRLAELDALWGKAGLDPENSMDWMTPPELIALARGGLVEIGAHTATHPRLPGLGYDAQLDEVESSKRDLEQVLGRPVDSFSYPYGQYDRTSMECVKAAGFLRACASGERAVTRRSNRLALPRIQAPDVSGDELERLLDSRLR
jgi:peptidoglycan/xylan/chitin deacetylase (PgdA/CDA1 family)